jgi:NADPH:quinone reductase-like Zn-dependent oxidoreductase
MQEKMVDAIEVNKIKPVINKTFALENIVDAFKFQESGQHFGKIVIEF